MENASFFLYGLALLYAFSNGFRDSASIVATVVSTRALAMWKAFVLCALGEFLGAAFVGSAVLKTIGKNLFGGIQVSPDLVLLVLASGLLGAILWGVVAWSQAWPMSNNQGLVSGLVGASAAGLGWDSFRLDVLIPVLFILVLSPFAGFILSALITRLIRWAGEYLTPKADRLARRLQIFSSFLVSMAHGSNDIQLVLGVVLVVGSLSATSHPFENGFFLPRLFLAMAISTGVLLGGKRILKRVGMSFYQIRSEQGLGAQLSSAGIILSCALGGFPASTTQVVTGSVIGAGVAKNPLAIRWDNALEVIFSWILTVPIVFTIGFFLCKALLFLRGMNVF